MIYATLADVRRLLDEDELVQLTDDTDTGLVAEEVIVQELTEASKLIDDYAGGPVAGEHAALRRCCAELVICALYDRRRGPPEHWKDRCKRAWAFLDEVASGKFRLGSEGPAGTGPALVNGPTRLFPHDELDRY